MFAHAAVTPNRSDLVEENLLLAHTIALRLKKHYPWLDLEDTYSYSLLGLTLAARSWQPDRGLSFGGFAGHKAMFLAIDEMRHDGLLRRKGSGRSPEVSLGGTRQTPSSYDPIDPGGQDGEEQVDVRDLLDHLLSTLRTADRNLLTMYYADDMTLAEIGYVLGVSESAVCLQHAALLKDLRRKTQAATRSDDREMGDVS
ncbi:MAG: sigma-70 family RNA polymerase sigma factor [Planctomycetota bacterium]|nr:sigma-70 family RNA polymerase sigma factor [Planctomycetota bacterium]